MCISAHTVERKLFRGAKWIVGNRTLLNFNFVKKKKLTEKSEDIYQLKVMSG